MTNGVFAVHIIYSNNERKGPVCFTNLDGSCKFKLSQLNMNSTTNSLATHGIEANHKPIENWVCISLGIPSSVMPKNAESSQVKSLQSLA